MAWQARDLFRQIAQVAPQGGLRAPRETRQLLELLTERAGRAVLGELGYLLQLTDRQVERLAELSHRRAQPIGGK